MIQIHNEERNNTGNPAFMLGLTFWMLGLLNNSSYVIMIASAKTISEGGTALVFLAMVVPSFLIQLTAPYWFDYVRYQVRMIFATCCMVTSFGLVASLLNAEPGGWTTVLELLGVAIGSAQCGLGEPTLLAAAGKCDTSGNGKLISLFASGTGLAGVFGFLWKFIWNELLGLSMPTTLRLAQSLALLYIGIFWKYLRPHLGESQNQYAPLARDEQALELTTHNDRASPYCRHTSPSPSEAEDNTSPNPNEAEENGAPLPPPVAREETTIQPLLPVQEMTLLDRARFVLTLWPYILPLFVVYAAEYSLQAGTWTAIGFPVSDKAARDKFYEYSNWMYQAGVFVSRSSGYLGTTPMWILWLMPTLQALNVRLFVLVAARHFWYSYAMLLPICFYVGLLGGAVYVQGYMRICSDFQQVDRREFALAATSVAASLGIVSADVLGLFIQACLYRTNNIDGAVVSCPW